MENIRQQVVIYKQDANLKKYLDWFIVFLDKNVYWDELHMFSLQSITNSKKPDPNVLQLFIDFNFIPNITWTKELDLYKHVGEAKLLHSIITNIINDNTTDGPDTNIESRAKRYLKDLAPIIKKHDDRVYELEEQNRTFHTYVKLLKNYMEDNLKDFKIPAYIDLEWVGEDVLKAPQSIQDVVIQTMNRIFNKKEEKEEEESEEEDIYTEEEEEEEKDTPHMKTMKMLQRARERQARTKKFLDTLTKCIQCDLPFYTRQNTQICSKCAGGGERE